MNKPVAIFVVLIVISAIGLFIGANQYIANQQQTHAVAVMRLVFESFYDEKLAEKDDGFKYGPDGIFDYLHLTVQQNSALQTFSALDHQGHVLDPWGGYIYVVKYGTGIRIYSPGPDRTRHTADDLEYR